MRVIEAFDKPIRIVTFSPDGRYLAAATEDALVVYSCDTGEQISAKVGVFNDRQIAFSQLAFSAKSEALYYTARPGGLVWISPTTSFPRDRVQCISPPWYAGGVAMSPDGKTLVATRIGPHRGATLDRWSFPGYESLTGFDFWSPFKRLAFSLSGEFLAGIDLELFELRIAVTGGLNGREQPRDRTSKAFLTFPRHGETVAFGWDEAFYIMETRAGNLLKRIASPGEPFVDAAFTGSGRHLATVDGTDVMRVWSADSWKVVSAYDWRAGDLTCIAVATDGLTGVCGTNDGRLIAFDVDE
jgi:WD40 repeat protein